MESTLKISDNCLLRVGDNQTTQHSTATFKLEAGVHWFCQEVYDQVENKKVIKNRLTASAFDLLASACGISVVLADHNIGDDGTKRPNPHIIHKDGMVQTILVRVYAVGRGPAGNMRCIDATVLHSPYALFCADIYERWMNVSYNNNDPRPNIREWGAVVSADAPIKNGYIRIPIVGVPGIFLEVFANHPEVLLLFREHKRSCISAERTAQTIANRVAVSKLLGIRYCNNDGTITLPVWSVRDMSRSEVEKVVNDRTVDGCVVEVEREEVQTTAEDTKGVDDIVENPLQAEPVVVEPKHDMQALYAEIRAALKQFKNPKTSKKVKEALAALECSSMEELHKADSYEKSKQFLDLILA